MDERGTAALPLTSQRAKSRKCVLQACTQQIFHIYIFCYLHLRHEGKVFVKLFLSFGTHEIITPHLYLLLLSCAGVVQYWHTPFGDLHTPGSHSKLDPVVMHHDGSLLVPNTSALHSGLYYCLLQHTEGTTLWPYELHVGHDGQNLQELGEYERSSHCAAFRFRRDTGSEAAKQAGVSAELFAGAVAASVLLTFVLGFSIGALSRTRVFR